MECNENGQIEEIAIGRTYSFEYDDEGNLEAKSSGHSDVDRFAYTYENGKVISVEQYVNNELIFGYDYEYNEYGHTTGYKRLNDSECTVEYIYDDDGRVQELTITEETQNGETNETTGEFEWDGTTEAEITFDGDAISCFGLPEDLEIKVEYDEHGNLLSMNWYIGGELGVEYTYTYKEVTVPGDYREVDINNPIWLTFFQG